MTNKIKTKDEALEALKTIIEDFTMLKDGDWVPDDDSCDCSIEMASQVFQFLTKLATEFETLKQPKSLSDSDLLSRVATRDTLQPILNLITERNVLRAQLDEALERLEELGVQPDAGVGS